MSDQSVLERLKKSPRLRFNDDGSVQPRWAGVAVVFLTGVAVPAVVLLWLSQRSGTWFGPRFILTGAVALLICHAMELKRQLRTARDPRQRFRWSLPELLVLMTALSIAIGGYALDRDQQARELERLDKAAASASALLGPNGSLDYRRRGRFEIKVADPTFDDERLRSLVELLAAEELLSSVTEIDFDRIGPSRGKPEYPQITDASVDHLLRLISLRFVDLRRTAMSVAAVERFTVLPNLRRLTAPDGFPPEAVDRAKLRHPDVRLNERR